MMRIGVLQFEPIFGDKKKNLETVERLVGDTSLDLLVLPELFSTGYQFAGREEAIELSEPIPSGSTCEHLGVLARAAGGVIVAGMAERDGDALYNSAVIVGGDGLISRYRKVHLFREEKTLFAPGDEGWDVTRIGNTGIGVLVCFDWVFPEAARTLALKGADIICVPSNLILPYCQQTMAVRAIENRVFTVVTNRIGTEEREGKERLTFTGQSQIADPTGNILLKLDKGQETLETVEIDPLKARDKFITPENHVLEDRRPHLYWR